jgi:hypothetical protein
VPMANTECPLMGYPAPSSGFIVVSMGWLAFYRRP